MIVLAGDIGGTNCRLALSENGTSLVEHSYPSAEAPSLEATVAGFLADEVPRALGRAVRPQRACLAVAGPVTDGVSAKITNLSWAVDAHRLQQDTGIAEVRLVNDFQAAALGVTLLAPEHLAPLGGGPREPNGPLVVTGPGTGLGQAFLTWSAGVGGYLVVPSEGGHADFAARTPLEWGLATFLASRHGRVSWERVLSGPGLADILEFLMTEPASRDLVTASTREALATDDPAAVIVRQAVAGADGVCALAVNVFCSALGALAGNLALTVLATGGVYLAGGIAPRILDILARGPFREAFEAKGRLAPVVRQIPVFVVKHPGVGLLGAAALARR